MSRRRPDPCQTLFRWVWDHDPRDPLPSDDIPEPAPAPLRGRVRNRHGPTTRALWGVPVTVAKAPGRPVERAGRPAPTEAAPAVTRGRAERRRPEPERKCTH